MAKVPEHRKRRRAPKVKTGCATCRIRRIKCDEIRPSCRKCSSTGRKCDGYSSDVTLSSQSPEESTELIQRISIHTPGNSEEKRGFEYFLQNTAAELSGYYDSSFWSKLILAASAQKPALRHAVVALGALHEDFAQKGLVFTGGKDQKSEFAVKQYAKAMGALRKSLASEKEEPLTALMSCILFVCFDSLRGYYESAMVHLESGLQILREMRRSSTVDHMVEDKLAPLLVRLTMQSIIYVETRSEEDQADFARGLANLSGKEIVIPDEFESLEVARNALVQAVDGLFRALYLWDQYLPAESQSPESLFLYAKYTTKLDLWTLAFERFMRSHSKDFTSKDLHGAALLKIHHTTTKIMVDEPFDTIDTLKAKATQCTPKAMEDFQTIINLSRSLIAATEANVKNGKPALTFSSDFGLIGPLYYVCVRCPVPSIRSTAMELLLRCPRREGMWNSVLIAQMIQQFWDLQAKHAEGQEIGFRSPEPFTDGGAVHFEYFGRPTEIDTFGITRLSETGSFSAVRSIPSRVSRSISASYENTSHQGSEAEVLATLNGELAPAQNFTFM